MSNVYVFPSREERTKKKWKIEVVSFAMTTDKVSDSSYVTLHFP